MFIDGGGGACQRAPKPPAFPPLLAKLAGARVVLQDRLPLRQTRPGPFLNP